MEGWMDAGMRRSETRPDSCVVQQRLAVRGVEYERLGGVGTSWGLCCHIGGLAEWSERAYGGGERGLSHGCRRRCAIGNAILCYAIFRGTRPERLGVTEAWQRKQKKIQGCWAGEGEDVSVRLTVTSDC